MRGIQLKVGTQVAVGRFPEGQRHLFVQVDAVMKFIPVFVGDIPMLGVNQVFFIKLCLLFVEQAVGPVRMEQGTGYQTLGVNVPFLEGFVLQQVEDHTQGEVGVGTGEEFSEQVFFWVLISFIQVLYDPAPASVRSVSEQFLIVSGPIFVGDEKFNRHIIEVAVDVDVGTYPLVGRVLGHVGSHDVVFHKVVVHHVSVADLFAPVVFDDVDVEFIPAVIAVDKIAVVAFTDKHVAPVASVDVGYNRAPGLVVEVETVGHLLQKTVSDAAIFPILSSCSQQDAFVSQIGLFIKEIHV
ncbi:MAG: hypothetical protein BWY72_02217 [Bacteroidetes bacterium ADurb.Bin416]|nr:MAG: hypothetical protein BWY72_02217 [Bacteroidetes bacterium ADurb.Bin416]